MFSVLPESAPNAALCFQNWTSLFSLGPGPRFCGYSFIPFSFKTRIFATLCFCAGDRLQSRMRFFSLSTEQ